MSIERYHEARSLVTLEDSNSPAYREWVVLMSRCYLLTPRKYKGFTMCSEWFDFKVFEAWYNDNWFYGGVLFVWGSKVHSPDSCTYISKELLRIIEMKDLPYRWDDGWRVDLTTLGYERISLGTYGSKREAMLVRDLMKEGLIGYLRTKGDI